MVWKAVVAGGLLVCGGNCLAQSDLEPEPVVVPPEAIFPDQDGKAVAAAVSNGCVKHGWSVEQFTDTMVLCTRPSADLTAFLLSPRGARLKELFRFVVIDKGEMVDVTAQNSIESTNVFGQTNTFNGSSLDQAQDLLVSVGGRYPVGTTFKGNNVGFSGVMTRMDGKRWGFEVRSVEPALAAARAGLQAGDIITLVNGKKFSNRSKFVERIHKPKWGEAINLTIERSGAPIQIQLVAESKPPVTDSPPSERGAAV